MAIYLKASTLTGNVTTQGFQNWVEIYDLEGPSVSTSVQMKTGQASDRVAVTHYSQHHKGSSTGQPLELIRLAFTQIQHTVIPRNAANQLGSPDTTGYDIEKASKL